jgi:Spy/CpxP family protein refolding chaperone
MMAVAERAPWQNPRILSTLTLVFLAGAAAGALSMRLGLHQQLHHTSAASTRSPQANRDLILNRFRTELDLTPAQTEKLALVLDDYRQYYQSLQDQLDDLRATGKNSITRILNPEQRVKFEKIITELEPQLGSGDK